VNNEDLNNRLIRTYRWRSCRVFRWQGHEVVGVDNNMRKEFFGEAGDTSWNLHRIYHKSKKFVHVPADIRDRSALKNYVFDAHGPFDAVIHCAAQPSHDKAKDIPIIDFEVNALGTMNLLELTRQSSPAAAFVFMSTNKVYGDAPNEIPLIEKETRWDYARGSFR
jgi:CDP-paratose 2-epimerase